MMALYKASKIGIWIKIGKQPAIGFTLFCLIELHHLFLIFLLVILIFVP